MPRVLLLVLALTLSACSLVGSDSAGVRTGAADGTLVNQTEASVYAFAVDFETSTLIDISPTIRITDENRARVIAPGEDAPLDVEAYDPGDDVVVFVYRVEGDEARYTTTVSVDGRTFERNRGVVTVRSL